MVVFVRKAMMIALAATAFVAVTANATVSASAAPKAVMAGDYLTNNDLNQIAGDYGGTLTTALAPYSAFGGIEIVPTGLEIDVVLSDPDAAALQAAVTQLPNPQLVPVLYQSVPYSLDQLDALISRVTSDLQSWLDQGISISAMGTFVDSDQVTVYLTSYSFAAASQLEQTYGPMLTVSTQSLVVRASGRKNDTSPWYGGDYIYSSSAQCTSWFPSYDYSTEYPVMLTAGHCGAGVFKNNGRNIGSVPISHVHWNDGGQADAESTNAISDNRPYVWADPNTNTRTVTGVGPAPVANRAICADGAISGEVCDLKVISKQCNITTVYNYNGGTIKSIKNQCEASSVSGTSNSEEGDSGGPVYSRPSDLSTDNASVTALGMIVAGSDDAAICYFTPVAQVLDAFVDDINVVTSS